MQALKMVHDRDPKEVIYETLGGAEKFLETMGDKVLVATYMRPEKTASGIILPENTREEDRFQGKVGLVIEVGPVAFTDDETHKFPVKPNKGDWVVFFPLTMTATSLSFLLNKQPMRWVRDVEVISRVKDGHQDMLW